MKIILLILSLALVCMGYDFNPDTVELVKITVEHELTFESYEILATVWYRSGDKWYAIDTDGYEHWSDKPIVEVMR